MSDSFPLSGQQIVCIASSSWDAMWVNAQHLMSRLARNNKVLYLNNMGLRPPSASKADLVKIKRRLAEWLEPAKELSPGCHVLSPIVVPLHKYGPIRWLNERLLLFSVRRWMKKLGMKKPILWIFLPTGLALIGKLNEKCVIYHCVDDYAQNPNVPKDRIRAMEKMLLQKADITFVTSPKLMEGRKDIAKRIQYFPNTADVPRFRDWQGTLPKEIQEIKEKNPDAKIFGYQGNISDYKTDLVLLERIADQFPDHFLVLVGPAGWGDPGTDLSRLRAKKNVIFTGRVDYSQLPSYLHGFDICLIPLNVNESTKGSFPMKFYEYMACGKPIVATALPAFEDYRDKPQIVRLADSKEDFLEEILKALDNLDNKDALAERIAEAQANDWEVRTRQIGKAVLQVMEENR